MVTKKKPAKKAAAKRARGRPSTYDAAKAKAICARLGKGEPLAVICRDAGMPPVRTVSQWKDDHPRFAADFARAREEGFDAIAAECLEIADETSNDTMVVGSGANEREAANTEWISRSKLRIETRLKLLAKWDPKRYGDKLALGGADDLPPIKASRPLSDLTTEELRAALARLGG